MFEIGKIYNRRSDIHSKYGGQEQGGISTPAKFPYIFIFTGNNGEQYGYTDGYNRPLAKVAKGFTITNTFATG